MVSHAEAAKKRAAAELGVPVGKLPVEHWDSEHLEALQARGADRWSPAPNRDGDPAFSGDLGSFGGSADEIPIYDNTPQSASEKSAPPSCVRRARRRECTCMHAKRWNLADPSSAACRSRPRAAPRKPHGAPGRLRWA